MEQTEMQNNTFPSFYDRYIQEDENMQAKIKPILNQIQENRVAVKELHTQYGIRFSEMVNSYINRLEELKASYETKISELQRQKNMILTDSNILLEDFKTQNFLKDL